jgi:hypothetical protein
MSWRLRILDPVHYETHSSAMAADRAVAFARDILASGQRVLGMESSEGEALNEDEIKELCAGATATTG